MSADKFDSAQIIKILDILLFYFYWIFSHFVGKCSRYPHFKLHLHIFFTYVPFTFFLENVVHIQLININQNLGQSGFREILNTKTTSVKINDDKHQVIYEKRVTLLILQIKQTMIFRLVYPVCWCPQGGRIIL